MEQINDNAAGSAFPGPTHRITVAPGPSLTLVVLEGPIDQDAAAELRLEAQRLLSGDAAVQIDWHAATYASAGAIQVLLALESALKARGRNLRVLRDNVEIRCFLELAGLSGHFSVMEQPG